MREFEKEVELNSVQDIINLNSILISKILKDKSELEVCNIVGHLLRLQLKCIELNSLEKRISELEERLK